MKFIKIYHLFKSENGDIWKIEEMFIPETNLDVWCKGTEDCNFKTNKELLNEGIQLTE